MVYRKRKVGRRMRKRPVKKNNKKRSSNVMVNTKDAFMAAAYYTKLKYVQRVGLIMSAGAVIQRLFRGNSLYDPDFNAGGGQPVGHATLSLLYAKYRVFGSKIKITSIVTDQGVGEGGYELALIPVNNGFGATPSPEDIRMNPRGKFRICGNVGGGSKQTITHYTTTASIQGEKKIQVQVSDEDAAIVTADPADPWFWVIAAQPVDHSSTMNIVVYVEITYFAKYEDRRPFNNTS